MYAIEFYDEKGNLFQTNSATYLKQITPNIFKDESVEEIISRVVNWMEVKVYYKVYLVGTDGYGRRINFP
jgi:hypothetical protein